MALRKYQNNVQPTSLSSSTTSSATTLNVSSTAGFPAVPFTVGVDRGTASEEVCLVSAVTPTTMTVTRGFDGTTGVSHNSAAAVEHCVCALDYREANSHIEDDTRDDHSQYLTLTTRTGGGSILSDYLPQWYHGVSISSVNPITSAYQQVISVTIPTATFSRKMQIQGMTNILGAVGGNVYQAAIRTGGTSVCVAEWHAPALVSKTLTVFSDDITLASGSPYTYGLFVRYDTTSPRTGSNGGSIQNDSLFTKLTAVVTANI